MVDSKDFVWFLFSVVITNMKTCLYMSQNQIRETKWNDVFILPCLLISGSSILPRFAHFTSSFISFINIDKITSISSFCSFFIYICQNHHKPRYTRFLSLIKFFNRLLGFRELILFWYLDFRNDANVIGILKWNLLIYWKKWVQNPLRVWFEEKISFHQEPSEWQK